MNCEQCDKEMEIGGKPARVNPFDSLCIYDPHYSDFNSFEDNPKAREKDCGCDNCFYGRDILAVEIIRLRIFE